MQNKKTRVLVAVVVMAMVFSGLAAFSGMASATGSGPWTATFTETNLPIGQVWYVNITGVTTSGPITVTATTGHNVTFTFPNGTYSYTIVSGTKEYKPSPASGSVTIAGANVATAVSFSMVSYTVAFKETGLTAGYTWDVIFNNLNQTSTTAYDNFTFQTNGTYAYTVSAKNFIADPASGTVTVKGKEAYENVTFTPQQTYSYLFSATGLAKNATYQVTMVSSSRIYASPLTLSQDDANVSGLINGTYTLTVTASPPAGVSRDYSAVIWSGTPATVAVSGKQASVQALSFEEQFRVSVTETGLPVGTSWSLTFNSVVTTSTSSTMSFNELNGSYSYSVGAVNGYLPNPVSSSVTVSGANITVGIAFSQSGVTYPVTFTEHGLPASTSWSLILGQFPGTSTSTTLTINVVNGTYSWLNVTDGNSHYYAAYPNATGTLVVAGKAVSENITFHYGYTVTFVPKNLIAYVPWSITYNGSLISAKTNSNITFTIDNGSNYKFFVGFPTPDWSATPSTGYVNVSGANEVFKLNMTKLYFPLTFTETGLPSGTLFSVVVNGTTYSSANGSIVLKVHNGTISYSVGSITDYTMAPASGSFAMPYSAKTISIAFTSTVKSGTGIGGSGISTTGIVTFLQSITGEVTVIVIAVLIIAGIAAFEMKGGKKEKKTKKKKSKKTFV
jgi:hypothetical protein